MKRPNLHRHLLRVSRSLAAHTALCAVVLSVVVSPSRRACAQTEQELAGARAAATEGAKAFNEGRYQEAIDLFERAQSLVHAPTHLLFMARAHEKLGHLVEARELYNKIIREKLEPDAPEPFKNAQASAAEEIKRVEPRLARLTITVAAPEGVDFVVTMDGMEMPAALLGIPTPVDPGEHTFEVKAERYVAEPRTTTLGEGESGSVKLELLPDPNAAPLPQANVSQTSPVTPVGQEVPPEQAGPSLAAPAYVALGVGALGIGAGVFFTLQSASKRSDADDKFAECRANGAGNTCRDDDPLAAEVATLDDDARKAQTMAAVGYIVGGVGVATGVVLLILNGSSSGEQAAGPTILPVVGYRSLGVVGTF